MIDIAMKLFERHQASIKMADGIFVSQAVAPVELDRAARNQLACLSNHNLGGGNGMGPDFRFGIDMRERLVKH